jgi:hypothetical protein
MGVEELLGYNEADPGIRFTAPEVRVLVVDDIKTNLYVAEGLLMGFMAAKGYITVNKNKAQLRITRPVYTWQLLSQQLQEPVGGSGHSRNVIRNLGKICENNIMD